MPTPIVHSFLYGGSLLVALYVLFLRPLAEEAAEMHLQQIDPTDIVLIPYDGTRLAFYVSTIATVVWILKGFLWLQLPLTLGIGFLMVLSGASLDLRTIWSAIYATALCLADPPLLLSGQQQQLVAASSSWRHELVQRFRGTEGRHSHRQQQQMMLARTVAQCTLAGAAVCQILRLYDRGWQVQRWPVPVILGSSIGWAVGVVAGTLWASRRQEEPLRWENDKE